MKISPKARLLSVLAALFLGLTGADEWSKKNVNASSWADDRRFTTWSLRAQGKLKIGLAIGFVALAYAGVSDDEHGNRN